MIRRTSLIALVALAFGIAGNVAAAPASYDDCVKGRWPNIDDAEARALACSKALQSHQLVPKEIALARLTRGVARLALGEKVLASDDYSEALKHYDSAIDWSKPDALEVYRRAVSHEGLGQIEQALSDYSEAIRLDPKNWLAFLGRGVLLAGRQRAYERAIEDFDKVLVLEPANVEALIARGSARSELGNNGSALVDLDQAIALSPEYLQAYIVRGMAHSRNGQVQLALDDYNAVLRRNPKNPTALTNRAGIYADQGKADLALHDLNQAIAIDTANPPAHFNLGYVHALKGEYDKALSEYSFAIALEPRMGLAYNNRCLVRTILGTDLRRALDDCDTALKLMPLNLDVRETRGTAFLKMGDPQLAIHEYDAALAVDSNRATSLFGRGIARIAAGQTPEGESDKAAALRLDPGIGRQFAPFGLK